MAAAPKPRMEPAGRHRCRNRALDDHQLADRARRGDAAAFEELVRRHQRDAHRVAWLVAGATGEAEDAVQEALVRAWLALDRFRPGAPFRPWLLRIVANQARNRRRAGSRREALQLRAPATASPDSPEDVTITANDRERVLAALDGLPERDRLVLACRYLLELSEAETAAVLDCPAGTVKSRTARAMDRLRGVLDEEVTRA